MTIERAWTGVESPRMRRRRLRILAAFLFWVLTGDLDGRLARRA